MPRLKFSTAKNPRPQSLAQRRQWKLFHALGYTMAMRGYIITWNAVLKAAGITLTVPLIDTARVKAIEKELRYQLKHIKKD